MAVVGLMNSLKQEGAKYGILVNTIAPVAATRMTEALLPPQLLPHLKPEYVSQAVAYLCSETCTATGDIISAGAGFYAKMTALLTVEGEKDDISGIGQTAAAHDICPNIPNRMRQHHLQAGVGHYGVFNGRRWREEIAPKVTA